MDNKKIAIIVVSILVALIIAIVIYTFLNVKYTVTFDSNGGTEVASQMVRRNGNAIEPQPPTKEGYSFLGWYTSQDEIFDFNTKITENITLTAKWILIEESENDVTTVKIVSDKNEIKINEEILLKLKVETSDEEVEAKAIKWSSSDETIAKVDKNGKVKGLKAGDVVITANINGIKTTINIKVLDKVLESKTNTNKEKTNTNTSVNNNTTTDNSNTNNNTEITYTYKWEKEELSTIGQYWLFIVSSEGNKVAGSVTITTTSGVSETVSIPASGTLFIRNTIANVSNIKV